MSRIGYLELIRTNADFRRIWLGDVASLLGDWFNTVALYELIRRLTGSPLALGLVFLTKMLPWALASPVAGFLADRFDRRRLMIAADLTRAVVVLGFLLIDEAGDVPLLYALIGLQVVLGAVFYPARSASIPNITSERELLTANTLMAATWSTLLAVGSALGGFAVEGLGIREVFVIDSLTYCVSAFFIYRTVIPQSTEPASGRRLRDAFGDVLDGWRHMWSEPRIGRIALTKAAWGLGGGSLVYMLALLGAEVTPEAPAVGIGLLYAARGLGTGLGPVAARAWVPNRSLWPLFFGLGIVLSGGVYFLVGWLEWSLLSIALVTLAHMPSGANWTLSSVLLQERTVDRFRGRVFATELQLLTLVNSAAIFAASLLLEGGGWTLRQGVFAFSALLVATGLAWIFLVVPRERRAEVGSVD